jgi:beta-lactamase regulating signal transducer with metallopeptidase domain
MIADIFYIVLFISLFVGGFSWLMLIFTQSIAKLRMPHFIYLILLLFWVVPLVSPSTKFINPETADTYADMFVTSANIWGIGVVAALCAFMLKSIILMLNVRKTKACTDIRVLEIAERLGKRLCMKRMPKIRYAINDVPACVTFCFRPVILLSKYTVSALSSVELKIVLLHELMHIKRFHTVGQRVFDILCCIHWFNPVIWIARREFALSCELDCDKQCIRIIDNDGAYAGTLLKLIDLSMKKSKLQKEGIGVIAFLEMKQRLSTVLAPASRIKRILALSLCCAILCSVVFVSLSISKSYFYMDGAPSEWSVEYAEY